MQRVGEDLRRGIADRLRRGSIRDLVRDLGDDAVDSAFGMCALSHKFRTDGVGCNLQKSPEYAWR